MSNRSRFVLTLGLMAVAAFAVQGLALAGEDAAPTASPPATTPAPAATAEAPKTAETPKAPETATPTPMHSLIAWVGKQVAPTLDCPCPAKAEGEQAWRAWFTGGASVPLATLRDRFVADGWTADRFVGFFKNMASKSCENADGASATDGECCKGKGERADGKPCCCKCKKKDEAKTEPGTAANPVTEIPAEKPAETPAQPTPSNP